MLSTLQKKLKSFNLPKSVKIESGVGDIPTICVENNSASAQINLLGGTVLSYQLHGSQPVLWKSAHQKFN